MLNSHCILTTLSLAVALYLCAAAQPSIYINAGGGDYIDSNNNTWIADTFYNTGNIFSVSTEISNTSDSFLYQSERWAKADLQYDIPVLNGDYTVVLHFSEVYMEASGRRVFSVSCEGETVVEQLDIFLLVGPDTALAIPISTSVQDELLTIVFDRDKQNPKINAIEVHPRMIGDASSSFVASQAPTNLQASSSPSSRPSSAPSISTPPTNLQASSSPSSRPSRAPSIATPVFELYINAGGGQYTDSNGITWAADSYYNTGTTYTARFVTIDETVDDSLYKSERYDRSRDPELKYDIPVPNGVYQVTLYWAENYAKDAGVRVFDVSMENALVFPSVDIFLESGGANHAMNRTTTVSVSDESLTIEFSRIAQNPKISAIAVRAIGGSNTNALPAEASAPSATPTLSLYPTLVPSSLPSLSQAPTDLETSPFSQQPSTVPSFAPSIGSGPTFESIRINAGGSAFTDSKGNVWLEDSYFNTGNVVSGNGLSINGTEDDALYASERWDPETGDELMYTIPIVPDGDYEVTLHFRETYVSSVGARVFNVSMEGEVIFSEVDIFAESGGERQVLRKTAIVSATGGSLDIGFVHITQNPSVSGIEVHAVSMGGEPSSDMPSSAPSSVPSLSMVPSDVPSGNPSDAGSHRPSVSIMPSSAPSLSEYPSSLPSEYMSEVPSHAPSAASSGPGFTPIFINCGGNAYTDTNGFEWVADAFFNTGSTYTARGVTIGNTTEQDLYLTERYDRSSGDDLVYSFPDIPNGEYEVTLYFSENYSGAAKVGGRVFSVAMEGEVVFPAVDIFVESGGAFQAMSKTAVVSVSDNELEISFEHIVQNPKISAIMIAAVPPVWTASGTESSAPSSAPSASLFPSSLPSNSPSTLHSESPSISLTPSLQPSSSIYPSFEPSHNPSTLGSQEPSVSSSPSLSSSSSASEHPSMTPTDAPSTASKAFEPIYINAGGDSPVVDDATGIVWEADNFYNTGNAASTTKSISGASFEEIYRVERYDTDDYPNMQYSIPLPDGRFRVKLYFADTWKGTWKVGARLFNVYVEDALELEELDIFQKVGKNTALVEDFVLDINDGSLDIRFEHVVENPKINAISVHPVGSVRPHYAHAVPGAPYFAVDVDNTGNATVALNGFFSHTHAPGAHLVSWTWKVDNEIVASGEQANITLDVGNHTLVLGVEDSVGDYSEDSTTVTVRPFGYPFIESLSPVAGDMIGGDKIVISGSGFGTSQTVVNFGDTVLSGPDEIEVIDDSTIVVFSNPQSSWGKVEVTVTTSLDTSNPVEYEYLPEIPLSFKTGDIETGIFGPTAVAFAPDGSLYVGTQGGDLIKYILDEALNVVERIVSNATLSEVYPRRTILGITFDPLDTCPPEVGCKAYISHSTLYHNLLESYNGVVSTVSGLNLDVVEHVVTGLPISDHDHGVNGLEFDDNGNLYIQVGGNTNAGAPGALSTSNEQEENLFSAATLIARNVTSPSFDGNITYDANGDQKSGDDVSVFASGMRNPFGIVHHSNGRLYGTDNGPNTNFGKASISCDDEEGPEPFEVDKLNLIEEGNYYGHANRKRGEKDPRQCSWRKGFVPSENYTMPIKKLDSSSNGICEFQSNHFGGAIRGDLIIARYKGALHHAKLANGGVKAAGEMTDEPPELVSQGGLDVTQGPDGTLVVASNFGGKVFFHAPDEEEADLMTVKSIFPRRGSEDGNTTLTIYGQKMFNATDDPTVLVGGLDCPVSDTLIYTDATLHTMQRIKCTLPAGVGSSDVVVSFADESYTFQSYRYIPGR